MFWYLRSQLSKQTNLADLQYLLKHALFSFAESCEKRTSNMKVYYITTLNFQLTGHPEKFKIKLHYFQEGLFLWYKSWSYCHRFIYVSSEITNFQNDLFFKENYWVRRFSILFSISLVIVCFKDVFHNIFGKTFFK